METTLTVYKTCIFCGKCVEISVPREGYEQWEAGALIQNAMPELTSDEREILISSVCGPCFDNTVGD